MRRRSTSSRSSTGSTSRSTRPSRRSRRATVGNRPVLLAPSHDSWLLAVDAACNDGENILGPEPAKVTTVAELESTLALEVEAGGVVVREIDAAKEPADDPVASTIVGRLPVLTRLVSADQSALDAARDGDGAAIEAAAARQDALNPDFSALGRTFGGLRRRFVRHLLQRRPDVVDRVGRRRLDRGRLSQLYSAGDGPSGLGREHAPLDELFGQPAGRVVVDDGERTQVLLPDRQDPAVVVTALTLDGRGVPGQGGGRVRGRRSRAARGR